MACVEKSNLNNYLLFNKVSGDLTLSQLQSSPDIEFCSGIPDAPTNLLVSDIKHNGFSLSWTSNSGGSESGFFIQISTDSGFSTIVQTQTVSSGTVSYDVTGLNTETLYYARVKATGTVLDSAYSNTVSATTLFAFTFQTNMSSGGTFDPQFSYSGTGTPYWAFEDGSEEVGAAISVAGSSVGLDGTTQDVFFICEDLTGITNITVDNLNLIGNLDFSPFAGSEITSGVRINGNLGVTGLDISDLDFTGTSCVLWAYSCALTSLTFPSSISGKFSFIYTFSNPSLGGTFPLGSFDFTDSAFINISGCNYSSITYHSSAMTGKYRIFNIASNSITGNQDLSNERFAANTTLLFSNNSGITGITDPSDFTGTTLNDISISGCNFSSLDLSSWTWYTTSTLALRANDNSSLTNVTLKAATISGEFVTFEVNNCSLATITNLDSIGNSSFDKDNFTLDIEDNSLTTSQINKILVDTVTATSSSSPTGRIVIAAGTNSAPDSSSGGNDGDAAVTTLVSRNFTVNVN